MDIRFRKYLPVAVGVVLGCAIPVAYNYWYDGHIERLGREEVQTNAERAINILNMRMDRVAVALNELVGAGKVTCSAEHIDDMRRAIFVAAPLKELSVIDSAGKQECTSLSLDMGVRQVVGSSGRSKYPDIAVEVVRVADARMNMVRLRRMLANGGSIAGLISSDFFAPITVKSRKDDDAYFRVTGPDGAAISEAKVSAVAEVSQHDLFSTTAESAEFGIHATVSRTRAQVLERHGGFYKYGMALSSFSGLLLIAMTFGLVRRQRRDTLDEYAVALSRGEFVPYYQPIIDITTGRLTGAEVLVRWRRADGSLTGPGAFIHVIEQNGLIGELTWHLMRQAVVDLGEAYGQRPHLRISFNLTAAQFEDQETVAEIRSIFARTPMKLSQIVLELTERQEPKSFENTREIIAALHRLGCKVALDDVGTGHSGLSSILKLGVDIIKIDKMFVDSMADDRNSAAIIGTLVDLARKLGMDTVAEGVERFEQVTELRRRGIRAAQGFVFAPALPASSFLQLVKAGGTGTATSPMAETPTAEAPTEAPAPVAPLAATA